MDEMNEDPRRLFEGAMNEAAQKLGMRIAKIASRSADSYILCPSEASDGSDPLGHIVFDGEGLTVRVRGYQRDVTDLEPEVDMWDGAFVADVMSAASLLAHGEGRDRLIRRLIPFLRPVKCKEIILPNGRNVTFYPEGKFSAFLVGVPTIAL